LHIKIDFSQRQVLYNVYLDQTVVIYLSGHNVGDLQWHRGGQQRWPNW
jgi:hypothetical protein